MLKHPTRRQQKPGPARTADKLDREKGLEFFKELKGEKSTDVEVMVEPIPFMGIVQLKDEEDK